MQGMTVGSDNPTVGAPQRASPENQQERLRYEGWVVGFVDGEGCFSCPLFRSPKMALGWQVRPEFAVVQGASSRHVLDEFVEFFGCGKVYLNRRKDNHREDLLRYCVQRHDDLRSIIVPFFRDNPLRTMKHENFVKFATVVEMMTEGVHLTSEGLKSIAEIVETMNHRKPSKYLRILRDHTPATSRERGEEMVRTPRRRGEVDRNDRPAL